MLDQRKSICITKFYLKLVLHLFSNLDSFMYMPIEFWNFAKFITLFKQFYNLTFVIDFELVSNLSKKLRFKRNSNKFIKLFGTKMKTIISII